MDGNCPHLQVSMHDDPLVPYVECASCSARFPITSFTWSFYGTTTAASSEASRYATVRRKAKQAQEMVRLKPKPNAMPVATWNDPTRDWVNDWKLAGTPRLPESQR